MLNLKKAFVTVAKKMSLLPVNSHRYPFCMSLTILKGQNMQHSGHMSPHFSS